MSLIRYTHPNALGIAPTAGLGGRVPRGVHRGQSDWPLRTALAGGTRDAIGEGSPSIQASRKEKSCEGESPVPFNRLVSIQDEVQAYKVSAAYRERHPDRDASQEGEGQAEVDHRVRQLNPGDSENQGETPHHCSTHSSHHSTTARTTTIDRKSTRLNSSH